ncbi:STAS/SEC14 domain-containing protein [Neptunomonas phycophila]|uniref:STAS/SEC14 domain-containing protein n=1 Tax=Neptunomonas phycophila TaxID=1572645 RepID=A0AAW7XEC1_9GAMM|nr:STAS/SEC14 domain-containing protein [Neptunomonas phycophila]MDO6452608.1 STAS/SEC14 domain-containing protein [Neptunomonas phycophila]
MLSVLPDTAGDFICVQASETLSTQDYQDILVPLIEDKVQKFGPLRMVIYFDQTFTGFEVGAIWEDAKLGINHAQDFIRIAIVGGPQWMDWAATFGNALTKGEVQHFSESQFLHALHWSNDGEV